MNLKAEGTLHNQVCRGCYEIVYCPESDIGKGHIVTNRIPKFQYIAALSPYETIIYSSLFIEPCMEQQSSEDPGKLIPCIGEREPNSYSNYEPGTKTRP